MIFSLIQFWSAECTSVPRERERDRTVARWSQGLCATARESSEYSRGIQSKINKRQGRSNTNKKISKQMDCASKWNIETKQAANRCQPSTVNFNFDFGGTSSDSVSTFYLHFIYVLFAQSPLYSLLSLSLSFSLSAFVLWFPIFNLCHQLEFEINQQLK